MRPPQNLLRPAGRQPQRPQRHRLRWILLALLVVACRRSSRSRPSAVRCSVSANGTPVLADLQRRDVAQTTLLFDRRGRLIARLHGAVDRVVVPSRRIPASLKQATVAVEDKRFYHHHGVDFQAIVRAAIADLRSGQPSQGASTITEQYVKNAYLDGADTLTRKVHEAILAWQLEDRWSKDRILTAYLNTVYYGNGAYGVQAAAQTFFHRNASKLTLAAVGAARRPAAGSQRLLADLRSDAALARRNVVLADMAAQGYITPAQERSALRTKVRVYRATPARRSAGTAYFVDYVEQQLVARYGARETFEGGLRVYTTLDRRMQHDALVAMKDTLPAGPAGALVSIDPANGFIRAMTTTLDWKTTKFDLAWQAHRQLGSAMKPFALTAAVEAGADPNTTFYTSQPLHIFLGAGSVPPFWDVSTFSHSYAGRINLVQATWQSDNTVYAQLALDLGPSKIVARGAQDGHPEPPGRLPVDRAGHRGRHAARGRRRLCHLRRRGHPSRPAGDPAGALPRRHGAARQGSSATAPCRPAWPTWSTRSSKATRASARRRPCRATTPESPPARPARPRTRQTPGSAASTPSWPRRCGWATRRQRCPCPASRAPPTVCRSGGATTRWSSARKPSPTSRSRPLCRSTRRGTVTTPRCVRTPAPSPSPHLRHADAGHEGAGTKAPAPAPTSPTPTASASAP